MSKKSNAEWSAKDLTTAQRILKNSVTVEAACLKIAAKTGHSADPSNLRRIFAKYCLGVPKNYLGENARLEAEAVDPIARKRESSEIKLLKTEHARLLELVEECNAREAVRDVLASAPLPPITRREFRNGVREATLVAVASDLHVEEQVEPSSATADNAYSLEIADLRMKRFFAGIRWQLAFKRPVFQLRDVVLGLAGDNLTGQIHEENVETGQLTQVESLLWLKPRFIAGIDSLLEDTQLERLDVVCSYGNHGRNTKKPMRARGAQHSYEWLMYQDLANYYATRGDKRVHFLANPDGHQYHQIYDFTRHQHHGDEVRFGGGVGGIMVPLSKAVYRWNAVRRADFHDIGHFHQYFQTPMIGVNGSGIGYNAYAMSIGAQPEPAQQLMYLVDSKRAKCEMTPLWLEDRSEENALRAARGWREWLTHITQPARKSRRKTAPTRRAA